MISSYDLKYKLVNPENFSIAFEIQKTIWPDDIDYNDIYDKANNAKDDNCLYLVYYNDLLIGLTGVDVFVEYTDTIWLDWIAVLPNYRKKGYGEKILNDTIKYCKNLHKFKFFRVETTYYKNRPAIFLYDKVMQMKEDYTIEDTKEKKYNKLIYSYSLLGELEPWNNKYLGLRKYYANLNTNFKNNKIGFTIGKFAPFHKGHEYLIEEALKIVDKLYVIVYDTKDYDICLKEKWIKNRFPTVEIIEAFNSPKQYGLDIDSINIQMKYLSNLIKNINMNYFFSSEDYGKYVSDYLNIENIIIDKDRIKYPIGSSSIRNDIEKYKNFISEEVYNDIKSILQ